MVGTDNDECGACSSGISSSTTNGWKIWAKGLGKLWETSAPRLSVELIRSRGDEGPPGDDSRWFGSANDLEFERLLFEGRRLGDRPFDFCEERRGCNPSMKGGLP